MVSSVANEIVPAYSLWNLLYSWTARPFPLLAAKKDQVLEVSSSTDAFVHFSCNIQLRDENIRDLDNLMLIQTHSCEREFNPINIYSWNAGDWDSNGVVHVEGKLDMRVTDMFQIKLNYTAFNATDNSLFFQCGVRLRSFNHPIYTCHKIQLTSKLFISHDLHLYLFHLYI